jgi:hypothetical protein
MKRYLSFIKGNLRFAYSTLPINTLPEEKTIRLNPMFYSFTGTGISTKYNQGQPDVLSLSGDSLAMDKTSGCKEIINVIQHKFAMPGEGNKTNSPIKSRSFWVWIATSSLIVFFAFSIIQNKIRNSELDGLYQTFYFMPDPASMYIQSYIDNNKNISAALHALINKNYTLALDKLQTIPANALSSGYVELFRSICLMQEQQYQRALSNLLLVRDRGNVMPDINFYAGLCYLKLGNVHSAMLLFNEIKDQQGVVGKKALKIISYLKTME